MKAEPENDGSSAARAWPRRASASLVRSAATCTAGVLPAAQRDGLGERERERRRCGRLGRPGGRRARGARRRHERSRQQDGDDLERGPVHSGPPRPAPGPPFGWVPDAAQEEFERHCRDVRAAGRWAGDPGRLTAG